MRCLHEDFAPLRPISFYGASKLAAEAYISVFAHTFGSRAVVLRFPNVVGERATHGIIYDFLRKLEADRGKLEVLGDGKQSKPYLYVHDLIDAMLIAWDKAEAPFAVYHAAGIGQYLGARDRRNRRRCGGQRGHAHRLYWRRSGLAGRCAKLSL